MTVKFEDGLETAFAFGKLDGRTHVCTPDYVSVKGKLAWPGKNLIGIIESKYV
jgi:hypothetical protein